MSKVIRVEPIEEVASIQWMLGKRCNYDCMYCPANLHDDFSPHRSLNELKLVWLSVVDKFAGTNLRYKISLSGGEITSNKHLLPFLTWLRENYNDSIASILVTTNGSATTKYYTKLMQLVDNISFSTHSEFINEQKFFATVVALKESLPESKFVHVNIMNETWNQRRIEKYVELLSRNQISYSVNEIDYSKGVRTIPLLNGKLNLDI